MARTKKAAAIWRTIWDLLLGADVERKRQSLLL